MLALPEDLRDLCDRGGADDEREGERLLEPLLDLVDVMRLLGVSEATVWRQRIAGTFPEPILVGERRIKWAPELSTPEQKYITGPE